MNTECGIYTCKRPAITNGYCASHPNGKFTKKPSKAPDWTERLSQEGYVLIKYGSRWYPQHQLVLQFTLRRKLREHESAHHKNGIRHDNRPENLELWLGGIRYGVRAIDIKCAHCGESYAVSNLPYGAARD